MCVLKYTHSLTYENTNRNEIHFILCYSKKKKRSSICFLGISHAFSNGGRGIILQETWSQMLKHMYTHVYTQTHTRTVLLSILWLELLALEMDSLCVPIYRVFSFKYSLNM